MEKIHTCNVCGVKSDAAPFYKRPTSRCKECHKEKVRENRVRKADYYREYDAKRFQEDPRVKRRHKAYQKTEAGKASMKKARSKWGEDNPEKVAATTILNNRVRNGKVSKPDTCQNCGAKPGRIEGHHEDYSRPLDVEWLCSQCHKDRHKELI